MDINFDSGWSGRAGNSLCWYAQGDKHGACQRAQKWTDQ